VEQTVTILNEEGLHARPAGNFVKEASKFKASIELRAGGKAINAKSILSVMSLGLTQGTSLTIAADGEDASTALESLVGLVNRRFVVES
jgi:phosphocarrier protein